jgi:predicted nucleotidyltransferase
MRWAARLRWGRLGFMSDADRLLAVNTECRDAWWRATGAALSSDDRVTAALLCGSFGRGDADEWSDIDIIVFISDDRLAGVVADRSRFGEPFGTAVYVLDSTWNAPVTGAQVNVLYRLDTGLPLYVDWNLWPLSMATQPLDTKVVFERSPGLIAPVATTFERWATYERQPRPSWPVVDEDFRRHAYFGMVPIAVKFCVRRQRQRLERLLHGIGATDIPNDARGEMAVIRERLGALSIGQPQSAVDAVDALCTLAESVLRT